MAESGMILQQYTKKGHLLVPAPGNDPPWAYAGAPIVLNRDGVYDLSLASTYPEGSPQAFANNEINYTYTSLLASLHALFNGDATAAQFNRAIGLMMSLKGQARAMAEGIPNPAVIIGPSFEYQPVNPKP